MEENNPTAEEIIIVPDDDIVPDDPEEPQNETQEPVQAKQIFGFGYDIELDENGLIKIPEVTLTKEIIRSGLSHVARTLDTFEFAYSRYDGRNKNMTNIDVLGEYVHLRVIDISGNQIKSLKPLANLKYLLVLNASENQLISLEEIPELPFLQALNVKGNGLTSTAGLFPNSLAYLQLSNNKLAKLENFNAKTFSWLTVLELRGNNLKTLRGLRLPQLVRLFVADNELSNLDGIKGCPNLTHLHARDNKISRLENFPKLEHLEYVNLRNNILSRFTQTKFLSNAPNIRTLIAMDNPISSLENYKAEMIATNINLRRLDKEPITEIDLVQGRQLRSSRDKGVAPMPVDDPGMVTPPISMLDEDGEEEEEEETSDPEESVKDDDVPEEYQPKPEGRRSDEGDLQGLKGVAIKKAAGT